MSGMHTTTQTELPMHAGLQFSVCSNTNVCHMARPPLTLKLEPVWS